ncbi:hypothetical protein GN958_ATG17711, partial [Phytophthora infestans]
ARQEMQNSHGRQITDATHLQRVTMGTATYMADLGFAFVSVDPTMRPSDGEALFKLQIILSKKMV